MIQWSNKWKIKTTSIIAKGKFLYGIDRWVNRPIEF